MTQPKPEPVNLKFTRMTPKWAYQRSARQMLVVAMYLLPLASFVTQLLLPATLALILIKVGAIVAALLCWAWVVGAGGAVGDMPDEYLDERQRSRRDHSYRFSYIYFSGSVTFLALYLFLAADASKLNLPLPAKADANWWFWLILYPAISLPSAVYAWIEPDLPKDEL
jgi:hypothetical protein